MASKKKGTRKAGATTRGKKKAGARKPKAAARKAKAATPRAKAGARKAKAATHKAKAPTRKAKTKRAPVRKRAPVVVAKIEPSTVERPSGPIILDEVIEESLLDVSTVLRIKDGVARSQRDIDEDELKQFPDPSLVVEAQTSIPRDDDTDPSISRLPDLFAAEARRQKERLGDRATDAGEKQQDSSLFGSIDAADDDEPDEA